MRIALLVNIVALTLLLGANALPAVTAPATTPAPTTAPPVSIFAVLAHQRQEKLYYRPETLPPAVSALILQPFALADAIHYAEHTSDEMITFNLVLIIDQRMRAQRLAPAERTLAKAFFMRCLRRGNPWITTEAVYALGCLGDLDTLPALQEMLDSDYATVVFHAMLAITTISHHLPGLSDDQLRRAATAQQAAMHGNEGLNVLADSELTQFLNASGGL